MNPTRHTVSQRCPSPQTWSEELESSCDDPRLIAHVEHCAQCRRLIDELAAEPQLWEEASETLATKFPDLTHVTQSICALADLPSQSSLSDSWHAHEITQLRSLLSPASHPELLARIGRYELEQLIGRGGMGLVFRAWDTELHRVVAVKTLAMALMPIGTARERFIREGRAAAMLNHPNIVPMYDVITEMPVPALVMQYIAGPTLESRIKEHGAMPWQDALRIGIQLADALDAAHTGGLVHRDIKPSNVLLEADGTRPLLTDFGLVRAMDDAALTHSGMLAGTPHFMSPEQARGEEVDGRSDLFSLGSLLYFAMSGQPPFHGREPMAVLNRVCHATQTSLCRIDREIPVEVARLVDRLLEKQAAKRPPSSRAVRDELRELVSAPRRLRPRLLKPLLHRRTLIAGALACGLLMMGISWSGVLAPASHQNFISGPAVKHGAGLGGTSSAVGAVSAAAAPATVDGGSADDPSLSAAEVSQTGSFTSYPSDSTYQFDDLEQLARQTAELESMIHMHEVSLNPATSDDTPLRQPFRNLSREAALIDFDLEQLRLSQPQIEDTSVKP